MGPPDLLAVSMPGVDGVVGEAGYGDRWESPPGKPGDGASLRMGLSGVGVEGLVVPASRLSLIE
jgi:hypothetical protein